MYGCAADSARSLDGYAAAASERRPGLGCQGRHARADPWFPEPNGTRRAAAWNAAWIFRPGRGLTRVACQAPRSLAFGLGARSRYASLRRASGPKGRAGTYALNSSGWAAAAYPGLRPPVCWDGMRFPAKARRARPGHSADRRSPSSPRHPIKRGYRL